MRIGMVLQTTFPPDIRVEKEAKALLEAGHRIFLLTSKTDIQAREESLNGIEVRRCVPLSKILGLSKVLLYLTHNSAPWKKAIETFIQENKIEVLHVHDLPLLRVAVEIARKYKIQVVADLHENYPAAVFAWSEGRPFFSKCAYTLFHYLCNWRRYEKDLLLKVARILVVVEEAKSRIVKEYSLDPSRITVVSNTEDIDSFGSLALDAAIQKEHAGKFVISYVGGFGHHRGLDTAIHAMKEVREQIPHALLLLVGGRGSEKEQMELLAKRLGLSSNVLCVGWVPFEKIPSYIAVSSICLVPHRKNPHTDTTLPHKLFQYMLMKKPVVVSDCAPLERIVSETKCGLVFLAGDPSDLASRVIDVWKNPQGYGENGYRAVVEKYNWGKEAKKLMELYYGLEART